MPKHTKIPAGYRLTVISWENDGDNYNTKVKDGLTKEETAFLVELIKLLESHHTSGLDFCNMYEPGDEEIAAFETAIKDVVAKHNVSKMSFAEYFAEPKDPEYYMDGPMDILGELGLSGSENYYTRVMDEFKVEFIPEEIKIKDVTKDFA